jgi:MFS family permease
MSVELGLEGHEYNNALVIFFAPYIFFEIPSNILLKKFKPHVWLSACMFLFGLTTTLQGVVTNYSGLLATRFFLGVFESGMFPGCFYLLSSWYLRTEAQRRYSFFFSSTTLAGAFAGLLAAAIGKMDGVAGYKGWRWVSYTSLHTQDCRLTRFNRSSSSKAFSLALSVLLSSSSSQISPKTSSGFLRKRGHLSSIASVANKVLQP